jgi:hypothetical protein
MRVVEVQEEVKKLRKNGKGRERVAQAFGRVDTSAFEGIESSEEHLYIRNSRRDILGYRICLPSAVFGTFRMFAAALPRICRCTHCRDRSSERHWVVWSDFSPKGRSRLSKDYGEDNNSSDGILVKWMEEYEELVKLLSHSLRMSLPCEYARGLKAGIMMRRKKGWEMLFQAWCVVAHNERMTGERGVAHKDAKDSGMNCAVLWGELTRGDVVLMELEKKLEVKMVDAFFLRGECIAHKRETVQRVRGVADIFTKKNVLNWYDKAKSRERRNKKEGLMKTNK